MREQAKLTQDIWGNYFRKDKDGKTIGIEYIQEVRSHQARLRDEIHKKYGTVLAGGVLSDDGSVFKMTRRTTGLQAKSRRNHNLRMRNHEAHLRNEVNNKIQKDKRERDRAKTHAVRSMSMTKYRKYKLNKRKEKTKVDKRNGDLVKKRSDLAKERFGQNIIFDKLVTDADP